MISLQFHYWVGFGYGLPQSAEAFEAEIASHVANGLLLGTKKQLERYKEYACKFPEFKAEINEILAEYLQWKN